MIIIYIAISRSLHDTDWWWVPQTEEKEWHSSQAEDKEAERLQAQVDVQHFRAAALSGTLSQHC